MEIIDVFSIHPDAGKIHGMWAEEGPSEFGNSGPPHDGVCTSEHRNEKGREVCG